MQELRAKALAEQRRSRTKISVADFLATKARTYEEFCTCLRVVDKDGKRVPFRPNRCQRRYMAARTRRDIVLKARQQGFTTEALARDLWYFLTHPSENVLIVCQSIDQNTALKDVTGKLQNLIQSLRDAGVDLPFRTETNTDWALDGRSGTLRVIEAGASKAAASKKGRAGTIGRLHLTEVAYWEFAGETLNAMLECVPANGGEIQIESTPNGAAPSVAKKDRDVKGANGAATFHWRYQDACEGLSGYSASFFEWWHTEEYFSPLEAGEEVVPTVEEQPLVAKGLTPEQIKWRRAKVGEKGPSTFDQEYPSDDVSCFLLSGRVFFDKDVMRALLARVEEPIERLPLRADGVHGELRIYHPPERGKQYVVSCDTAQGTGGDGVAAHVYERGSGRHMATLDGQLKPWEFGRASAGLGQRYGWALIVVERNNHGAAVLMSLIAGQKYPNVFYDMDGEPGWNNTEASRAPALDRLEIAVRAGNWKTKDRAILGEMRTFIINDRGRAEGARGAHDDHVMACAIGWDVLCRAVARRNFSNLPPG